MNTRVGTLTAVAASNCRLQQKSHQLSSLKCDHSGRFCRHHNRHCAHWSINSTSFFIFMTRWGKATTLTSFWRYNLSQWRQDARSVRTREIFLASKTADGDGGDTKRWSFAANYETFSATAARFCKTRNILRTKSMYVTRTECVHTNYIHFAFKYKSVTFLHK